MINDEKLKVILKWGETERWIERATLFVILILVYFFKDDYKDVGYILGGAFVFFTVVRTGVHNTQIRALIRYIDSNASQDK